LVHVVHSRVGVIRVNEVGVKYGFILGLKKLMLLKSISQFTKKKNKQTKKEKENKPMLGLT